MYTSNLTNVEYTVMDIAELRRKLGQRIEAAHFGKEPTMIRHGKRGELRAALVPAEWVEELLRLRGEQTEPNPETETGQP